MELVGRAEKIGEVEGSLLVLFRCCNHETFELWLPLSLKRIPVNALVRVWSRYVKLPAKGGSLRPELIIHHWEDLSRG
jgi:hypothetical protein